MRQPYPTMTPIRPADKELLKRIAAARDWSQTSAVGRAVRMLAEAERIEVEGECVGIGAAGGDESTAASR